MTTGQRTDAEYCDIRTIIEQGDLAVHFQEIISLSRKTVVGFEGLIRGVDAELQTLIPPETLFRSAYEQDMTLELDRACREKVLEAFSASFRDVKDKLLFLNLDATILDRVAGSDYLSRQVRSYGIDPKNIVIEINEGQVQDLKALENFYAVYRKRGFMVALDDVGTGFSNMDRILLVRPDIIKIDITLVKQIQNDPYKQGVFKSLINLSRMIGALVIAEGVESLDEAVQIAKLGGHMMQGYFFAETHFACDTETNEHSLQKIEQVIDRFNQNIRSVTQEEKKKNRQINSIIRSCVKELGSASAQEFDHQLLQLTWSYRDIECAYILDENGIQISNTIRFCNEDDIKDNLIFYSASPGTDHSMEKYYYAMQGARSDKYITEPYVSLATGNLCITISKVFESINAQKYILCLDFCKADATEEIGALQEFNVSNLVFNINGQSVSELNHMINKMNEEIIRDSLTNTYNRRYMEERLLIDVFDAFSAGQPISVVMADIDHFKKVNDTYGHQAGDHVLKEFAAIAKRSIRKNHDWIARYGGEEFLIVLLNANAQAAHNVAEKIREAIESSEITYKENDIKITASFGVCTLHDKNMTYDELIRKADKNLYQAKKEGRNRTVS